MKKILIFFMFLLSLTSLSERFIVISKDGYTNLREEASTKSKILKKVDNNYIIFEIDKNRDKDWYWVHAQKYSKKDGYINLRSRPSTSSKVLDNLGNGAYVTRYPEKTVGDWYYVDYNVDGGDITFMEGYIHKSQLKKYKE